LYAFRVPRGRGLCQDRQATAAADAVGEPREAWREEADAGQKKVPDTFWLVSDGFCEKLISLFGRYASAGATCMGTRSANHTGCPDGGDGLRSHPPDGLTAKNWNRPCGKSRG
jgi:hypothetical protein